MEKLLLEVDVFSALLALSKQQLRNLCNIYRIETLTAKQRTREYMANKLSVHVKDSAVTLNLYEEKQ